MKRCPTCGSIYTNDELVFCLQDGATLQNASDARQQSYDPEATLNLQASERPLPPPVDFKAQAAPTRRHQAPPLTAPPRPQPHTSDNQTPAATAPQRSTSPVVVAGITAIVVLLLVIAGIGVALLVRDSSQGGAGAEGNNRAAGNESGGGNNSNTANNRAGDNGAKQNNDPSNKANANGDGNKDVTPANAFARAESGVVRGALLEEGELAALSREELRRLRNAVYARHGRTFDSPDLQRYFEGRSWYKPRSDYTESSLTQTDLANIKLIQTVENSRA